MGWVDWLLRPFRGQKAGSEAAQEAPAGAVSARAEADKAPARQPQAEKAAPTKPPSAAKPKRKARPKPEEGGQKKAKKARKLEKHRLADQASQGKPADKPKVAEILPVEEAERRYGAAVAPRPEIKAETEPREPLVETAAPSEPEPPPPLSPRDPAEEARRTAAAENRRRARLPQFQALISRTEALLAVQGADPRHLVSARRSLVEGFRELGRPPAEEEAALTAAKERALGLLDERIAKAAEVERVVRESKLAEKWAVVEEARALAEREDLKGAGPAMGELRVKLRAVGNLGPDDPTIAAFAAAEARLKERQEQIRSDRDSHRQKQLEALEQLVARAEALANSKDTEAAAERVKALQATWKTVRVPGPRTEPDAAWARFRAACDAVFAARSKAREESQKVTLERMEAIVAGLETIAKDGAQNDPEDDITRAMNAWKRAGRAPREAQQVLWERMQRAIAELRAPVDLGDQGAPELHFRPFERLNRDGLE